MERAAQQQDRTEVHQQLLEAYRRLTPENRARLMDYLETLRAQPESPKYVLDSEH